MVNQKRLARLKYETELRGSFLKVLSDDPYAEKTTLMAAIITLLTEQNSQCEVMDFNAIRNEFDTIMNLLFDGRSTKHKAKGR
ncbi:hypothetical protein PspCFBP13528_22355 [Pseudomonas sp. CFBP13528]|uniref:hypothetical protein n=1 Tax=Pseudomonas sp. CFBP13528 TaxID=2184006 RepID=UPI0010C12A06|nr:hypothetical protein [Pseudomonas sp. CFBP13528]TKK27377.1 hypothetical protein PspCFBP13528_22355 [Pseudomonas sp. CFBP13528]